jgi:uncharacterized protein (DUF58 family)
MPVRKKKRVIFGQSQAGRFLRNFYLFKLTHAGKYILVFSALVPLLGVFAFSSFTLLYVLISFSLLTIIMDPILSRLFLPRLKAEVFTPVRAAAGSMVPQEIKVENATRRNAYLTFIRNVKLPPEVEAVEEQGVLLPLLKSGGSVKFRINLEFPERGEYRLDWLRVDSSFPLGLMRSGYDVNLNRRIFIYPDFKPIMNFDIPAGRKLQPGGIALASKLGESTEFLGTREFRDGDDPRFIHWRSWGRLNQPIVKEFQEEYFARIALFLDSYVPLKSRKKSYESFEALLSLGASISDFLQRQEYIIDILCAGPQIYYLQAGRSLAYLDQILDILACLDVCREKPYSRVEPHLMEDLSRVSTVIVLLLDWDDERRDFLLRIREMGTELKIFLVSDSISPANASSIESLFGPVSILDPESIQRGIETL